MKAILISTRPQWVELILNGIKKDEIRKGTAIGKAINKLIKEQGVAPMLIYCTKGNKHECLEYADNPNPNEEGKWCITSGYPYANGKVVARFNATAEEITPFEEYESPFGMAYKLTKDKIVCCQKAQLTYDEYNHYLKGEKGTAIHINDLEIFDEPKEINEFSIKVFPHRKDNLMTRYLSRAPQSWCYIEI